MHITHVSKKQIVVELEMGGKQFILTEKDERLHIAGSRDGNFERIGYKADDGCNNTDTLTLK